MNIVVGEAFYNSLKDKQDLNLKIAFELQKDVADDKNLVTEDKVKVRGEGSSWNYIKLAKSEFNVTLPDSYPDGGKIYDISSDTTNNPDGKNTFSFNWGSYFDGKAPSEFYKEKEGNRVEGQSFRDYYQKAAQELQAMKTALTTKPGTLKLTATFVYPKVGE